MQILLNLRFTVGQTKNEVWYMIIPRESIRLHLSMKIIWNMQKSLIYRRRWEVTNIRP